MITDPPQNVNKRDVVYVLFLHLNVKKARPSHLYSLVNEDLRIKFTLSFRFYIIYDILYQKFVAVGEVNRQKMK